MFEPRKVAYLQMSVLLIALIVGVVCVDGYILLGVGLLVTAIIAILIK